MIEKRQNDRRIQVVERELVGRELPVLLQKVEQQPKGVAIGGDGLGAHLFVLQQVLGKERAEQGAERDGGAHGATLPFVT